MNGGGLMKLKLFTIFLVIFLMLFSINNSFAELENEKVEWLVERGYVTGYPDGSFGLDKSITRAEVATIVVRALESEGTSEILKGVQGKFKDVQTNYWANGHINYVSSMGYVNGYPDNTFKPGNNITFAEILKILVMVNGDLPEMTATNGQYWATPYIIKAVERGILDGIVVSEGNYNLKATREAVFEMLYNTIRNRIPEDMENYTSIVVGNSRTSRLANDEIEVEIISVDQDSGNEKSSHSTGDRVIIELDRTYNTADLLGRVVKVSLTSDDRLIEMFDDTSFEYYQGPVLLKSDIAILSTGETVEVNTNKRFQERLYSLYYNDREYSYSNFVEEYSDVVDSYEPGYVVEFARITIKDGDIYFIDSFDFNDISPVAKVENKGKEIVIYDDSQDGSTKTVYIKSAVGYYNGELVRIDLRDILVEDVLHIYGDKAIVRMDAAYTGLYKGVTTSSGIYYVLINKQYFQIRRTDNKKPVYSTIGDEFFSLTDYQSEESLGGLVGGRVIFMIDLNESLQLITSFVD